MRTVYSGLLFIGLIGNLVFFQNCGEPFKAAGGGSGGESATPLSTSEPPPLEEGQLMTFSAMTGAELNLAEQKSVSGTISSLEGFSGLVNLSVDRSELNLKDAEQNVKIDVQPASVNLPSNGSVNFTVTVTSDDMAPSFDLSTVKITATDDSGQSLPAKIDLNVRVNPVVELRMNGDSDPLKRWDRPSGALNFRDHPQGMTVKFFNTDATTEHIVHGSGSIPHGPINNPMASPATDGQDGGVYEVSIASGTSNSGNYYYHDLGPDGDERQMFFGVTSSTMGVLNTKSSVSPAMQAQLEGKRLPPDTDGCPPGED